MWTNLIMLVVNALETRMMRRKRERTTAAKHLATAALTLVQVSWLPLLLLSVVIWAAVYRGHPVYELVTTLQKAYIIVVLLYVSITTFEYRPLILLMKNTFKILFNVWVVSFILAASLPTLQQTAYVIVIALVVSYLETCLEVHDMITPYVQDKIKFILSPSMGSTLSVISVIHIIVAISSRWVLGRLS